LPLSNGFTLTCSDGPSKTGETNTRTRRIAGQHPDSAPPQGIDRQHRWRSCTSRCTIEEYRQHFNAALEESLINQELPRQAKWTEAISVGERAFVEASEDRIRWQQRMSVPEHGESWVLSEEYGSFFDLEK
jgi:hypothetical protein